MRQGESDEGRNFPPEYSRDVVGGLGMLGERHSSLSTEPTRFGATQQTWERWGREMWLLTAFRACDALALYHHLDPDLLGLTTDEPHYFNELCRQLKSEPNHPVKQFERELLQLDDDILNRRLEVYEFKRYLTQSYTRLGWFFPYIKGRPVISMSSGRSSEPGMDLMAGPPPWPCQHMTEKLHLTIRAQGLYATPVEGGTYVPGDLRTAPDVAAFVRAQNKPSSWASEIARILRPAELRLGRPPKTKVDPSLGEQ